MNKKIIITIITALVLGVAIGSFIIIKNNKKPKLSANNGNGGVVENLNDKDTESTTEEEEKLLNITDVVVDDKSGALSDDIKEDIINSCSEETDRYMRLIFNYSEYTDEYKNNLLKGMADTEKYPRTKYYYVDSIIESFAENEVICSVNDVKILGVTIASEVDGAYEVTVRGYADVNYRSKDLNEDKRYIVFEDHLCKDGDSITHFDPYFNYMLRQEGFKCGLLDDGSNTIRYKGKSVFEFNLEQYNPEYEQAQEIEKEYEKKIQEKTDTSTGTDSDKDSTEE